MESQIQIKREIKDMAGQLDKLKTELKEVKLTLKKISQGTDLGLERGLKEAREGKGRFYKSLDQWEKDMRAHS